MHALPDKVKHPFAKQVFAHIAPVRREAAIRPPGTRGDSYLASIRYTLVCVTM
jgi:hypothetical protein